MSDEQVNDLKQFFRGELSLTEQRLTDKIDNVRVEMQEGFAGIADIITTHNDQHDDYEERLTALEAKAA